MSVRPRTDHYLGRLHMIVRGYRSHPQWGFIVWGVGTPLYTTPTLDVWLRRTLYTFRWVRHGE